MALGFRYFWCKDQHSDAEQAVMTGVQVAYRKRLCQVTLPRVKPPALHCTEQEDSPSESVAAADALCRSAAAGAGAYNREDVAALVAEHIHLANQHAGYQLRNQQLPAYLEYVDKDNHVPFKVDPSLLHREHWTRVHLSDPFAAQRQAIIAQLFQYIHERLNKHEIRSFYADSPRALVLFEMLDWISNMSTRPSYALLEEVQHRIEYVEDLLCPGLFPASHRTSMLYVLCELLGLLEQLFQQVHGCLRESSAEVFIYDLRCQLRSALYLWPHFLLTLLSSAPAPTEWVPLQFLVCDRLVGAHHSEFATTALAHLIRAVLLHPSYTKSILPQDPQWDQSTNEPIPDVLSRHLRAWPIMRECENLIVKGRPLLPRCLLSAFKFKSSDASAAQRWLAGDPNLCSLQSSDGRTQDEQARDAQELWSLVITLLGNLISASRLYAAFEQMNQVNEDLGKVKLFSEYRSLVNQTLERHFEITRNIKSAQQTLLDKMNQYRRSCIYRTGRMPASSKWNKNVTKAITVLLPRLDLAMSCCDQAAHQLYAEVNAMDASQLNSVCKQLKREFVETHHNVIEQIRTDIDEAV
mmetsp:Transcript_43011/g.108621  ORF Transcript_43011/g.108621 Transcript_43011/m.108621 type:complete len:580 (-) Transcript_43011:70-1809(-)|eukprot:CAMPEP_0177645580 /NCGR_PEP_ID=MMETSP0447-20121125/9325_1 /TAXON_ID=0 /ORGANISM="Stygamoeba regulata, Strain BSH-02190019" /LENGTH=579 /DNA_ID=CAMNT_0019148073 /DNA_START=404 /DNA_END=2143 /DNA_ORIENTATION=-